METKAQYTDSWVGQDGRTYRSVKYWVGTGWTAGFLQVKDVFGQWTGV